jgi:tRNA threonylcarbamoyladenosine biosynthesis protein TsaB
MQILAIETSTLTGSVALLSDDRLLGELTLSVSVQHSERLMPAIEQILRDASITPEEVDAYAVAVGPGSFTGLRIGIAAAQGLALAHGKPLVGVSSLEGLARNVLYFPGVIVPLVNAYRNEIYRGRYRSDKDRLIPLDEDRVMGMKELLEEMRRGEEDILLLGNGLDVYGDEIRQTAERRVHFASPIFHIPRAAQIAALSYEKSIDSKYLEPILPRYLRLPG